MTLALTLWTKDAFLVASQRQHLLHGLFFGILIGLLVYNLFLLFSLRDVNYLYFVILLAATIFFVASYDGYIEDLCHSQSILPGQYYLPLSFSLLFVSMILFADSFLEIKTRLPKLHRANLAILGVWGVPVLLIPFTSYHVIA